MNCLQASSVVSAPVLAFFTLPVFFVAFPRPFRFWPGVFGLQANQSKDSVYYAQMIQPLVGALHKANRSGRLGLQQPGNHLIVRHEDRIVWVQILEQGNNFSYYGCKGMELQETSCHSLEATRLDDLFTETFEKASNVNQFAFHTVTPLASLPVMTYSDSKNVLTGVLEAPETLKTIAKTFIKTLGWYMVKMMVERTKDQVRVAFVEENVVEQDVTSTFTHLDNVVVPLEPIADCDVAEVVTQSESINGIELGEWPDSSQEASPEDHRRKNRWAVQVDNDISAGRSSAYEHRTNSDMSIFDNISDFDASNQTEAASANLDSYLSRKNLLPPIRKDDPLKKTDSIESLNRKLDSVLLPGGIGFDKTPQLVRRRSILASTSDSLLSPTNLRQPAFKTSLAKHLAPDPAWMAVDNTQGPFHEHCSNDWMLSIVHKFVKEHLEAKQENDVDDQIEQILNDESLFSSYERVCNHCFSLVYGNGNSFDELATYQGPALPAKVFRGDLPRSATAEWFREKAKGLLQKVVFPAYKAAVKLSLDQVLIGEYASDSELEDELTELDTNWHLGQDKDPSWQEAVINEKPNLFCLTSADSYGGGGGAIRKIYKSRLLALRECKVNVGRLNAEVVKGLWASLNLELLYLTNDDDERYSIQAEERVLRNLTVQVADAPLGYTIYSSQPIRRGIEL